jgi:hypothetical protein
MCTQSCEKLGARKKTKRRRPFARVRTEKKDLFKDSPPARFLDETCDGKNQNNRATSQKFIRDP